MSNNQALPKQELHELMVETFLMIENLNINEGDYLQFADLFKKMNLSVEKLVNMKTILINNTYYRRYIKNTTTIRRHRLTEEQKRKNDKYITCNCGRFIHKREERHHLKSQIHYQGRRNRIYAKTKSNDEVVNMCISREVALQAFIINHLIKINNLEVDNEGQDEMPII